MKPNISKKIKKSSERAILVMAKLARSSRAEVSDSLDELKSLVYSAGGLVLDILSQEVKSMDPAYFIGRGKVEELKQKAEALKADVVIFDEDLSATQNRNLEEALQKKVIDRTGLILDIFAQRAKTREGKLQVELAQAIYLLPRLVGQWGHFSRQAGGIGTRGPGETQLEVDRRRIREKISRIRKELERVRSARKIHRSRRLGIPIPTLSLIGYTNAGKSTLMKTLTKANVLIEDKLFATLDPTVRRLKLPSGREVLLADTVGFIQKLPHALVESFKATFEEIMGSDLLIHVIDVSHPAKLQQESMVQKVLEELKLDQKPVLEVYNKVDLLGFNYEQKKNKIYLSALKEKGISPLLLALDKRLAKDFKKVHLKIPYSEGALIAFLHQYARVLSKDYEGEGIRLEVEVYEKYLPQLKKYRIGEKKPRH